MSIEVVVLPVAGLGTRFLPATKAVPKEMLPVVDVPLVQLAVEEAARAGIRDVVLVTSASKRAIEDHFDHSWELENMLEHRAKHELLEQVRGVLPRGMRVTTVRQPQALGLGHAVLCARTVVGNRNFAVMLPDDLIDAPAPGCLADMVALHRETGAFSLAVEEVPRDRTDRYGIVSLKGERISAVVEKPKPDVAPSTLAIVGRYVLPAGIMGVLENATPGAGGEIQLTDAIATMLADADFRPHRFAGVRYDCGSKLGYVQANVAFALRDAEMGDPLREWLRGRLT
ncbi:MAG TPA: UTP--glucose-1-phosphate uridylyltransferase [Moraxellaceae bacterium]|nr:UTP--glucose-1-phosphate uridylyltransferase [Moraxellaceae bacterium]